MKLTKCCPILATDGFIFFSLANNRSVVDVGDDPGELDVDDDGDCDMDEKPDVVEFIFYSYFYS
ncbi:hypothetical protein DERF_011300 [Dermatophagoides farinae]|uniref:Uncharacterized protein n=1 Tax=Dermatophagoides farinae TaxID=6954 RepID=A0A922L4N1_DERFA|nr:hypothetical protein DERF_011300 [Dermatophagoides farinae]